MHRKALAAFLSILFLVPQLPGQKKFPLTIDNIMRGPGLVGYEPDQVRWLRSGDQIAFQWKQSTDPISNPPDTYVINRDGSGLRKFAELEPSPPAFTNYSKDHMRELYAQDGDLFLYDRNTGQTRQLTKTSDNEADPHFLRDEKRVSFRRGNNLYVMSLADGELTEVTDVQAAGEAPPAASPAGPRQGPPVARATATAADEKKGTDSQEFLKKEEKSLLEVVRDRARLKEEEEARKKRRNPRKPFKLTTGQTVLALDLSPDEKSVMVVIQNRGEGLKNTIVPNYVTEDAYTADIAGRTNVGDSQGLARVALVSVESGEVKWVEHGLKLPKDGDKKEQDREVQLGPPVWSEDGTKAVISGRAIDNKDRWIFALDPATGKTRTLFVDHDDAWVGGFGFFALAWTKDDKAVYFQSERDGFTHLYTVDFDGGEPRQLTAGKFEVSGVELSRDKSTFYLTTSEAGPGERHLYTMPAEGGARTRITTLPGNHHATLSPDEKWIADVYSYTNKPPELFIMENKPGAAERKLTSSPAPDFAEYQWIDTPIVQIPSRDGKSIPAHIYKPANFKKGGPAVMFVHGAGYTQNVHRWWSPNYYREYLFNQYLMEHGYLVIDIDYRASSGYGRDWRTGIYRHMGGKDLDDHVDAAKWLVEKHGVDAKRIGLYGGSYGGFITLMALFTQPDVFAAGAALRPVTDWAHYNHGYTASILNTPQKDAEAYRLSSPIYFASGLKGALLICHGMVDTNVHFQDTVRLVQKLIELRKENWSVAIYPVEDHGFVQPSSWADEYKRIFQLFEANLKK